MCYAVGGIFGRKGDWKKSCGILHNLQKAVQNLRDLERALTNQRV